MSWRDAFLEQRKKAQWHGLCCDLLQVLILEGVLLQVEIKKKPVIWSIAVIVAMVLILPILTVFLYPMAYVGLLERGISTTTGLTATVSHLEVDLFPARIAVRDLRVSNPATNLDKPLLHVTDVAVTADLSGWWNQAPAWWSANLDNAVVYVGESANGSSLWQTSAGDGSAGQRDPRVEVDDSIRATMAFESVNFANVDVHQITTEATYTLHISNFLLTKDNDARLKVEMDGDFEGESMNASGTLALPSSERAREVDFRAELLGAEVHLAGTVGHDGVIPGEAQFSVRLEDISNLSKMMRKDYSYLQPLEFSGSLAAPRQGSWTLTAQGQMAGQMMQVNTDLEINTEQYVLENLQAVFGESNLQGSGALNVVGKVIELNLSSDNLDVDQLMELSGSTDNPTQATSSDGSVDELAAWQIDIDTTFQKIQYAGYQVENLALTLNANGDGFMAADGSVQHLVTPAPWELVEPVDFSASFSVAPNLQGERIANFSGSTRGISISVDGTLAQAETLVAKGSASVRVDSIAALENPEFDKSRWEAFLPLVLNMDADAAPSSIQISSLDLQVIEERVDGEVDIDWSGDMPKVSGVLHAEKLDISGFRVTPSPEQLQSDVDQRETSRELISSSPLDWSWLEAANLDLNVSLDELVFNNTSFRNLELNVIQRDARLDIDPLRADLAEGGIRGSLTIEKRVDAPPRIETKLIVTQLTPADLGQKNAGLIDGGTTDILINLETRGVSAQDLADHLNGEIALEIQRAHIRNNILEILGSDLLMETVNLINPFASRDDETELECAAAFFRAEDGILTSPDQLVIETGKMKIRGGGEINLRQETLQIDFVPRSREGLGISLSGLAGMVRLGGTLAQPRPVVDPAGILSAGASIGAAISTGGLSLLAEGLFDRASTAGGTACGDIFENLPDTEIPSDIQVDEN